MEHPHSTGDEIFQQAGDRFGTRVVVPGEVLSRNIACPSGPRLGDLRRGVGPFPGRGGRRRPVIALDDALFVCAPGPAGSGLGGQERE